MRSIILAIVALLVVAFSTAYATETTLSNTLTGVFTRVSELISYQGIPKEFYVVHTFKGEVIRNKKITLKEGMDADDALTFLGGLDDATSVQMKPMKGGVDGSQLPYKLGLRYLEKYIDRPTEILGLEFLKKNFLEDPKYKEGSVVHIEVGLKKGRRLVVNTVTKSDKLVKDINLATMPKPPMDVLSGDDAVRRFLDLEEGEEYMRQLNQLYMMVLEPGHVVEISLAQAVVEEIIAIMSATMDEEVRKNLGKLVDDRFAEIRGAVTRMHQDHEAFKHALVTLTDQIYFLQQDMLSAVVELGKIPRVNKSPHSALASDSGRAQSPHNTGSGTQNNTVGDNSPIANYYGTVIRINGMPFGTIGGSRIQLTERNGYYYYQIDRYRDVNQPRSVSFGGY